MMTQDSELAKRFLEIVKEVISESGASPLTEDEEARCMTPCPNQAVGRIGNLSSQEIFERRYNVDQLSTDEKCVILVLESPHKYEYVKDESGRWIAKGPARGCTGCRIRWYLHGILKNQIFSTRDYAQWTLVLVNAVRFQCSLGRDISDDDGRLKNKILLRCLEESIFKDDFGNKIQDVMRDRECLVINACTSVARDKVGKILQRVIGGSEFVTIHGHPSSWMRKKTLKVEFGDKNFEAIDL